MKKQGWTHHRRFIGLGIQSIIMAVLTALTLITTITIGLLLYNRLNGDEADGCVERREYGRKYGG